jgi:uncharacterized protein with PQ loop repeat
MRRNALKISVGIIAFVIGTTATVIWLIYPLSQNPITEVSPPESVATQEAEEYAVYSAVIKNLYLKEKKLTEPLLITNRTTFYGNQIESVVIGDTFLTEMTAEQRVSWLKKIAPSVSEETLFDYDEKQMKSKEIRPKFDLPVEYNLVNEGSKKDYSSERSIRFSSVGFNKQRNLAYVFTQFACIALCGSSDFLLLEKVEGKWEIKEIFVGMRS